MEELLAAAIALLAARKITPMTYEDAYYFTFKTPDRDIWDALEKAVDDYIRSQVP
jgi:hypothetical protein